MSFIHIIQREVYFLGHCAQKPNGEHVPGLFVTSLFCWFFFFLLNHNGCISYHFIYIYNI